MERSARWVGIIFGLWVFLSAFLWRHSPAGFVSTMLVGIVVAASSAIAMQVPWFHYVTAGAGLWLIAALFAWSEPIALTVWHNFMVGVGIVIPAAMGSSSLHVVRSKKQIESTA
jgi:hypothetical protein